LLTIVSALFHHILDTAGPNSLTELKNKLILHPANGSVAQSRFEQSHFDFVIKSRILEKQKLKISVFRDWIEQQCLTDR